MRLKSQTVLVIACAALIWIAPSNARAQPTTTTLAGCAAATAYSTQHRGVSVVAMSNGEIVCEGYANGGGAEVGHELWSGTKSFTGIMAAIAVRDGLLSSLDEPVSDTIVEWRTDPERARITVRQLLSLTSGVRSTVGRAPDYADALASPMTAAPGERFQYGPAPFQIFGELMRRKLAAAEYDGDALAYLRTRLLDPLGMDSARWRRSPAGDAMMPQGAVFTARDWSKFGEFVRSGGRINGVEVVDRDTFRELFVGSSAHPGYGVSWWLAHPSNNETVATAPSDIGRRAGELPSDLVMAAGAGDQRLYVIPSLGLTIVRQAQFDVAAIRDARGPGRRRSGQAWSDTDFVLLMLGAETTQ